MAGCVRLAVALCCCFHAGCGTPVDPLAFPMSHSLKEAPPRPTLRFTAPSGSVKAKIGAKVDSRIEVEVPEGGPLPATVQLWIYAGNRVVGGGMFEPVSSEGRIYRFSCRLRVPPNTGTYQMRIEAQYCIEPPGFVAGSTKQTVGLQILEFQERGPNLEVTR